MLSARVLSVALCQSTLKHLLCIIDDLRPMNIRRLMLFAAILSPSGGRTVALDASCVAASVGQARPGHLQTLPSVARFKSQTIIFGCHIRVCAKRTFGKALKWSGQDL